MGALRQVCDLGLARTDEAWQTAPSDAATNPRWLAPEVLEGGANTTASDVYAFGIVMCAPSRHPCVTGACGRCSSQHSVLPAR